MTLAGSWPDPIEIEQMSVSLLRGDAGADAAQGFERVRPPSA